MKNKLYLATGKAKYAGYVARLYVLAKDKREAKKIVDYEWGTTIFSCVEIELIKDRAGVLQKYV